MIFSDHFYNKTSIIFTNVKYKKELIRKITSLSNLNIIIITKNPIKFKYLLNNKIKFSNTLNIKINENCLVIIESLRNRFQFKSVQSELLDKNPLSNIIILSEIRNFNLIDQYKFNNVIINTQYLNFKLKLKLFYIRLFKYKFSDIQDYLIWIKKNNHKNWLIYEFNNSKLSFFNLNEFTNNVPVNQVDFYEVFLDYVYS